MRAGTAVPIVDLPVVDRGEITFKEKRMKLQLNRLSMALVNATLVTLAGCGSGSGSGDDASVISAPSQLVGTAATGAALANATVSITNRAGSSPCAEASVITTPLGSYVCTVKIGEAAPFFIVVTDLTGNTSPLVSIATTTPPVGTALTVNATPLTTAIVAQLNGGDALGVVSDKNKYVAANFEAIKANVLAQIAKVLTSLGAPADYDPFTTSITAATATQTGNTADQVLDIVKITTDASGALALSTISDPTPVTLASAINAGAAVREPPADVSDLAKGTQLSAQAFNACFSLPVATRVTLDNMQNIASVANECQSIVTSAGVPINAPAFKHNGYSASDYFYNMLTSGNMTGAKFSVPEIMAFYPKDGETVLRDRAVLNIRYVDNLGHAGNRITVAENFLGSSNTSRPSNWWLTGNQKNYDISISTEVWRQEQFNSNPSSNFRNALRIWIEARSWAPQNAQVTSVRVTGPGYPTLGLWYTRTIASGLALTKERSVTLPASFNPVCPSCISYWISKTQGLKDAAATSYAPNAVRGNWAQGTADGSYNGLNGASVARPKKGDVYTFEVYNGNTKIATEKRTLLTNLVEVTQLVKLPWNDIGPKSHAALDPTNASLNGAQASLPIDWIQNPMAEFIRSAWISQTDGGSENTTQFPLGATSVTATPSNESTYTALNVPVIEGPTTYAGYREIGFNYRMTDGSTKATSYSYWP